MRAPVAAAATRLSCSGSTATGTWSRPNPTTPVHGPSPSPSPTPGTCHRQWHHILKGTVTCPVGTTEITNKAACEAAAKDLGLHFDSKLSQNSPAFPRGCFRSGMVTRISKESQLVRYRIVYENTHPTGVSEAKAAEPGYAYAMICLSKNPSTKPSPNLGTKNHDDLLWIQILAPFSILGVIFITGHFSKKDPCSCHKEEVANPMYEQPCALLIVQWGNSNECVYICAAYVAHKAERQRHANIDAIDQFAVQVWRRRRWR